MNAMSMRAEIQCDDHVETLIFQRTIWKPDDELLEFSIMDSYIGKRTYQGVLGRFRRAWHAFFATFNISGRSAVDSSLTILPDCQSILQQMLSCDKSLAFASKSSRYSAPHNAKLDL